MQYYDLYYDARLSGISIIIRYYHSIRYILTIYYLVQILYMLGTFFKLKTLECIL